MTADVRAFFVYRVFDDDDRLLYVGCTNRPSHRWSEHRSQNPKMASLAARFRVAGPYTRTVARDLERFLLCTEFPRFGMTPLKQIAIQRALSWQRRRAADLAKSGWDYMTAWKLAAVEAEDQFPGEPTSYSDVTGAMRQDVPS